MQHFLNLDVESKEIVSHIMRRQRSIFNEFLEHHKAKILDTKIPNPVEPDCVFSLHLKDYESSYEIFSWFKGQIADYYSNKEAKFIHALDFEWHCKTLRVSPEQVSLLIGVSGQNIKYLTSKHPVIIISPSKNKVL